MPPDNPSLSSINPHSSLPQCRQDVHIEADRSSALVKITASSRTLLKNAVVDSLGGSMRSPALQQALEHIGQLSDGDTIHVKLTNDSIDFTEMKRQEFRPIENTQQSFQRLNLGDRHAGKRLIAKVEQGQEYINTTRENSKHFSVQIPSQLRQFNLNLFDRQDHQRPMADNTQPNSLMQSYPARSAVTHTGSDTSAPRNHAELFSGSDAEVASIGSSHSAHNPQESTGEPSLNANYFREVGALLQYPDCCVEQFVEQMESEADAPAYLIEDDSPFWGTGYVPCACCHDETKEMTADEADSWLAAQTGRANFILGAGLQQYVETQTELNPEKSEAHILSELKKSIAEAIEQENSAQISRYIKQQLDSALSAQITEAREELLSLLPQLHLTDTPTSPQALTASLFAQYQGLESHNAGDTKLIMNDDVFRVLLGIDPAVDLTQLTIPTEDDAEATPLLSLMTDINYQFSEMIETGYRQASGIALRLEQDINEGKIASFNQNIEFFEGSRIGSLFNHFSINDKVRQLG